jgi:hypothetical protein
MDTQQPICNGNLRVRAAFRGLAKRQLQSYLLQLEMR